MRAQQMTELGIQNNEPPPIMPGALLCTIPQGAAFISRGIRFVYEAIATGRIRAVKSNKRTLVVVESLREYVASLPSAKIKPMPVREHHRCKGRGGQ